MLTEDFHKRDRRATLLAREPLLAQAWKQLTAACEQHDPQRLGEAATLSAIASQDLLPKPGFSELHALADKGKIYGLNVAHSGSVAGLIYDDTLHDKDFIYETVILLKMCSNSMVRFNATKGYFNQGFRGISKGKHDKG